MDARMPMRLRVSRIELQEYARRTVQAGGIQRIHPAAAADHAGRAGRGERRMHRQQRLHLAGLHPRGDHREGVGEGDAHLVEHRIGDVLEAGTADEVCDDVEIVSVERRWIGHDLHRTPLRMSTGPP
jgi:hypothetical protein